MLATLNPGKQVRSGTQWPQFLKQRMDAFYDQRWREEWQGRHIMRGRQADAQSVQLVSNDYLDLAGHPSIVEAQISALEHTRDSVLMSGVFLPEDAPQHRFERRAAEWLGYPAAILSQSGYAANVGLIQAVVEPGLPVYMDMHAHASLWEGVVSAGATVRPFRHNDLAHLKRQMERYGPGLLCVDSVYSTMGSLCRLTEIVDLAEQYGCLILVDESHSLGTHGPDGSGLVREHALMSRVHFVTASLAKAFAGRAGIIFCSQDFADYFWFTARPAIFSSCLLPHEIAALDQTLTVVQQESWRREALFRNADLLRQGLDELGYNVSDSQSQIIALEAGLEYSTLCLREALEDFNVFGSVFCAPATPKKRSLLRLSVNAGLTVDDLTTVLHACERVRDQVGMWDWPSTRRKVERAPFCALAS